MTGPGTTHPREDEAIEFVLGTLSAAERVAFVAAMGRDPALAALVLAWEERLVPLASQVPDATPSAGLWERIAAAVAARPAGSEVVAWPVSAEVVRLRRSRAVWRAATAAAGSLAAALAFLVAGERVLPGVPSAGLVAVVNRSGELPALLVRVDPRAGVVQVRALAAEAPADRSLELWSIVGGAAPRSLGVIGASGVTRASLPAGGSVPLDGATLAVSVEPRGGSTAGGPTGPVIYTGRLVSETP